ncbi:hypothetical protein MN116_008572 [Schistosoma mekongi]|uniref:Uncharacterized protein n=1 Tax=Schistosoma mekongi TaxID=38744 RepID=A0AAE1Z6C7_SCHME|nr:hypothetical protein MN116_008572 [Schistosoma mekongi]
MAPKKRRNQNAVKHSTKIEKLTPKEAILDYQIGNLRNLISRLKFKQETLKNMLKEKVDILTSLKLQEEAILKENSSKLMEISVDDEALVSSDDTKNYMLETWKIRNSEETEVMKIQEEIETTQRLVKDVNLELKNWHTYSEVTKKLNETRIQMLEMEYVNMKQRFESMMGYLTKEENQNELGIQTDIERSSENIKNSVVDKAVNILNKSLSQQMFQNNWLKVEKKILDEKIERISHEIEDLQKENITAAQDVFSCNLPHILIPLSFGDIQVTEKDDLRKSTVLDLKLDQNMFSTKKDLENYKQDENKNEGSLQMMQENLPSTYQSNVKQVLHKFNGEMFSPNKLPSQIIDIEHLAALGPLEKKACYLQGIPSKFDRQNDFSSPEFRAHLKFNPELDNWPVNRDMLSKYLSRYS